MNALAWTMLILGGATTAGGDEPGPLDPSARLLEGSEASEYWSLYVELESGHRIAQQFLLSNSGPGDHNAVAVGHLVEPGRAAFRYENGRRRGRWKLSEDRLFFDIAASHLDLHRPTGELRITKDVIEIRLFFDFPPDTLAARIPDDRLPTDYHVDVLAIGTPTRGSIHAPWMSEPLETHGRLWLSHTWTPKSEAELIDRRVEILGHENGTSFYGLRVTKHDEFAGDWIVASATTPNIIESRINIPAHWEELKRSRAGQGESTYPLPSGFRFSRGPNSGHIALGEEWLRFDPLSVIPQPFRWFIRRSTNPRQVWAEARIGVTLLPSPGSPSLPDTGEVVSDPNSNRETEKETAERSVTGVASITFMNPSERR